MFLIFPITLGTVAKVNAFNGEEWRDVPALETRRNVQSGLSLRDQFV
jgi:hypothetical protein